MAADVLTAAALAADAATEIRSLASGTADSGTTLTMVDAARTEFDTDWWKGSLIVFTSGTLLGQTRLITGFTPASDTITFTPATTQAVATHTYEIWPAGRVDIGSILGVGVSVSTGQLGVNVVSANGTAWASGAITAASIANDAITDAKVASDVTIASVAGAVGSVTAAVTLVNDPRIVKNSAYNNFTFRMTLTSDHVLPATGKTVSCFISKDGAAFAATATATATEISNGWYKVNLTSTEMNADEIILYMTATACDQTDFKIITQNTL
jgi:hypothetical protein